MFEDSLFSHSLVIYQSTWYMNDYQDYIGQKPEYCKIYCLNQMVNDCSVELKSSKPPSSLILPLGVPNSMKILKYFNHHHHRSIIPSIWGILKYYCVAKYPKIMLPSLFLEEGWIFVGFMSSAVCFSIEIYIELSFNS